MNLDLLPPAPATRARAVRRLAASLAGAVTLAVAAAACGGSSAPASAPPPSAAAPGSAATPAAGGATTAAATASSSSAPASSAAPAAPTTPARGATSTATGAAGCRGDGSPVLCFAVELTGAVTVAGTGVGDTFDTASSCREWAPGRKMGDTTLRLMPSSVTVAGHALAPDFGALYKGPGTYDLADVAAVGDGQVAVDDRVFEHHRGATKASITFAADGSGSLTFDGLTELGGAGTLTGTMRWTCGDPTA